MRKQRFDITGMTCSACSARVEKTVSNLEGVAEANVNLLKNSMSVAFDNSVISEDAIIAAVQKAGYGAALHAGELDAENSAGIGLERVRAGYCFTNVIYAGANVQMDANRIIVEQSLSAGFHTRTGATVSIRATSLLGAV